ncbi:MAG: chalcone isomerase family protein [Halofilum sp. (in: g-proteobacteria)]|nr:chalcone isomerase family protein [Halofilum sp. (in: g-proteobacteria)]
MTRALVLALAVLVALPAFARTVAGVSLADSATARDGTALVLHGAGLREKFFFDIYVGALYLPSGGQSVEAILERDRPARVEMHFVYDEVSREQLAEAWREGFRDNNPAERREAVAGRLERFVALFPAAVEGDVLALEYVPGDGTRVSVNGEPRGTIAGRDFFRALLGVFLGPEPADRSMKAGMLGR